MNAEEQRLLTGFLDQLKGIRGIQKDPDADLLIRKVAGDQPDALYLLVQKALIQDQALSGARQQIVALERQLEDARTASGTASTGGFLSQNPWSGSTSRQQPAAMAAPQAPPYPASMAPPAPMSSGFGGFLGSAAATAAGVAGGAFLFHGIESMMGHHGGGLGYSDTGYGDGHHADNVTINEYYGDGALPPTHEAGYSPVEDQQDLEEDWDSYNDDVNSVDV
ncbi:MAG: DUF2076 family protein [Gammaproteobacteria bacterium]|nr:DUF2076 family protein [Gammaproteobacteria bacterium]NBT44840.1 DUF2076 family protein [Gammaproteobacteria bacterium]NBY23178.1 DUF2076 family protein [Gammaproteobacteria bacterium]NDE33793.1 DUF2076 family protein [Gammaproteobacteria bacterium]NDE55709.1 DUF2076 family protein [Gammaproteobacteria bacterium]